MNTVGKIAQINSLVIFLGQVTAIHRVNFPSVIISLDLAEVIPHTLPRFADSTAGNSRDLSGEKNEKKVKPER